MKIRNGFVSNSSSSSFIVAIKDGESTKLNFKGEHDGKTIECELHIPGTEAYDIESLKNLFKWEFSFDIDEAMKNKEGNETGIENFEKCKKALEEGKYIIGFGDLMGGQTWEPNVWLTDDDDDEGVDNDALLYNNGGVSAFINPETMEVIAEEYGRGVV